MKNVLWILAFCITLVGCTREFPEGEVVTPTKPSKHSQYRHLGIELVDIDGCKMLSFPSWQVFDSTAQDLLYQLEEHDSNFVAQYSSYSDDELDSIEIAIGFQPQEPLIDFEGSLSFDNSFRETFNYEHDLYMEDTTQTTENPEAKYFFSENERSLINDRQEVMIGGFVYKFVQVGYFIVKDDVCSTLNYIHANSEPPPGDTTTEVHLDVDSTRSPTCGWWRSSRQTVWYDSDVSVR